MPVKTIPIHGKDHLPNGSDPIPGIQVSGGATPGTSWHDLVTSHGPLFWWYFQDPDTDNAFDDQSGNNHQMTMAGFAEKPQRSSLAHMFADQTYCCLTQNSGNCYGYFGGTGTWADGLTGFSVEIWHQPTSINRAVYVGNQALVSAAGHWDVGVNASGHYSARRFGSSIDTGITPIVGAWQQFVLTGDGTTIRLYHNGDQVGTMADVAGDADGGNTAWGQCFKWDESVSVHYAPAGYFGTIIGYTTALTAGQVSDLYQAGLAAANPANPPPPADLGGGIVYPGQIKPGPDNTWLESLGGVAQWATLPASGALPADVVVAAATRIIASFLAAGDTQPAWRVLGNGRQEWGAGGTTAPDAFFERIAAGLLRSTGASLYTGAADQNNGASTGAGMALGSGGGAISVRASAALAFGAVVIGDTVGTFRWQTDSNGKQQWGTGLAAADTNLYRLAAGQLATDTDLVARATGTKAVLGTAGAGAGLLLGTDTNLYRAGANLLKTDGGFYCVGDILANYGNATGQIWFSPTATGQLRWGSPFDTTLHRSAAGVLTVGSILIADHQTSVASVTTARTGGAAAGLPAAPVKYLALRDETGARVYVPAYT